ncbi:MGMT family protein [Mangrovibacterium marinum]|uniref:Methylated-DNA-protein-cysteine methyltransferase-like protein n=1 Tax=Mangrovibacterium marinum TaxID=1639118 RepID=A0A2T5C6L0_9BACT|nr:MGMT family protein [Mangrovibacterium marinum]PTN10587.1 methylated-DNA-protein-cysteine methyltransferase-like protein [Mangrovibacterium marinum]
MNDFFDMVYQVVRLIPPGRVTSYGAIARYLGTGQSARMVGWAMNKAGAQPVYVPAHRVVNAQGLLSGKHNFGNSSAMEDLLLSEGIRVENNQIINFAEVFWDPTKELMIE